MKHKTLELTPAQQDTYPEGKIFGKVVNNIGGYQIYRYDLDVSRIRQSRGSLLRENDAYRLRFNEIDGRCSPFANDTPPTVLAIVECAMEASASARVNERMTTAFPTFPPTFSRTLCSG